jgi:hypothetical protein
MTRPKPPSGLEVAGLNYWRTVTSAWQLEPHQHAILVEACRTLDLIATCQAAVDRDGPVLVDRFNQSKAHPAALLLRDYRGLFSRLVRELGLADDTSDSRPPTLRNRYRSRD